MDTTILLQLERVQLDPAYPQETTDYNDQEEEYFPAIPINTDFPKVEEDLFLAPMIADMTRRRLPCCHNRIHFGMQDFRLAVPIRTDETSELYELEGIILQWFREKLLQSVITETVPILLDPPQLSAESLMDKLRQESKSLHGLGRLMIKIRAGHVFSLLMVGDTVVIDPGEQTFAQLFPLFIDVSIKAEPAALNSCQVAVAMCIAPMKAASDNDGGDDVPSSPSDFENDTGLICCMYEELATVAGLDVTSGQYFYHGGYSGGISESS